MSTTGQLDCQLDCGHLFSFPLSLTKLGQGWEYVAQQKNACLARTRPCCHPQRYQTDTSKAICFQQYFSPGPGGEPFRFKERLEDKNLSIIYLVHLVARYCCTLHVTRKLCNQHHPFLLFSCKDTQTQHSLKSCSQKWDVTRASGSCTVLSC